MLDSCKQKEYFSSKPTQYLSCNEINTNEDVLMSTNGIEDYKSYILQQKELLQKIHHQQKKLRHYSHSKHRSLTPMKKANTEYHYAPDLNHSSSFCTSKVSSIKSNKSASNQFVFDLRLLCDFALNYCILFFFSFLFVLFFLNFIHLL
jgi:hypothetical protein